MIGKIFGRLLVLEKYDDGKKYSYMYKCECQCENKTIKIVNKERLVNNKTTSCDCLREEKELEKYLSHIGEKYNKLTIIDFIGKRDDTTSSGLFYECKCDCGSSKIIKSTLYDLKSSDIKSCGICNVVSSKTKNKISKSKKKHNTFIEHDLYMEGFTENGKSFIFDKDDFNRIKDINKYITINSLNYVLFSDKKNGDFQLHRFIMGLEKYDKKLDIIVDHINGNTLDNRKENLRICHRSKNPKNSSIYKNNTSGCKGITWMKRLNKWQVSIQVDKKSIYLGIYDNLNDAIEVRKQAEIKYFGEYSRGYGKLIKGSD